MPSGRDQIATQSHPNERWLAALLAMAMFVFVIDTSLMNVSIYAVVRDLDTTVSGVQSAVAIEALVSAAFILIGSKLGDLFGRRRAFVGGLLLYISGALAMVVADRLAPVIIFWAVIGGLGASLYLPTMQALIHGNFQGASEAKAYALVGAAAAIAAAIGPLLGGFLTTYLSWRVGFLLEAVIIVAVLIGCRSLLQDVPYVGDRSLDPVGAALSVLGMGGLVLGILAWQEGGEYVGGLLLLGLVAMGLFIRWLRKRKAQHRPALLDVGLFESKLFGFGIAQGILQQLALGGMLIALPIFLQMVLGYDAMQAGLSLAPLSLTMFVVAILAGRSAGKIRPAALIRAGFALLTLALVLLILAVPGADSGWDLALPLVISGLGLGLLVSQLNNYTLASISDERAGEAAGVNSATGSFGLSLGLAFAGAIMLAALSIAFTQKSEASDVLSAGEQAQVAAALERDAQIMSDTQLEELLVGQPADVRAEILAINKDSRPLALQIALLIPLLSALGGLLASFRMMRLPDPAAPVPDAADIAVSG
jgi:EmrB/QacA subfamily drug resistance transporter